LWFCLFQGKKGEESALRERKGTHLPRTKPTFSLLSSFCGKEKEREEKILFLNWGGGKKGGRYSFGGKKLTEEVTLMREKKGNAIRGEGEGGHRPQKVDKAGCRHSGFAGGGKGIANGGPLSISSFLRKGEGKRNSYSYILLMLRGAS